jgi:hypothetical protein
VRGVETDASRNGHWVVLYVHTTNSGADRTSTVYDNLDEGYDFDAIELRKGYVLHLVYVEDADGDGRASREEFLHGTRDDRADTDADGLSDATEVHEGWEIPVAASISRKVFSDPLEPDADTDGLADLGERMNGTDPGKRDTDGDAIWDLADTPMVPEDMHERAHLILDANTVDVRRSGRFGIVVGTEIYGPDRNDNPVGALSLDGSTDLQVPGFDTHANDGMTYSFWFKAEDLKNQAIMTLGSDFNKIALWMYASGGLGAMGHINGRLLIFTDPDFIEEDRWHHIAGVLSDEDDMPGTGTESFSLYIDGEHVRTVKDSREPRVTAHAGWWSFGSAEQTPDGLIQDNFRGSVDDIRLFRRGLDAAEIELLARER